MQAFMTALALALLSQLADGRYPAADAAAGGPSAPAVPDVAAPQSEIRISSETPQPTLVEGAGAAGSAAAPAATGSGLAGSGAVTDVAPPPAANPFNAPPASNASTPTGGTNTQVDAAGESSVLAGKPADLMRQLLKPPAIGQLPGVPVTLGAAVRDAATRAAQTQRAQAYWNLSAAVAQYYLALQEAAELELIRQGVSAPSPAWNAASEDAKRRIELTHQTAAAAQMHLYRLMGAAGVSLPLPADAPHCGRYNTRYDEIFATRQDPAARQINDLLPKLHGELAAGVRLDLEAREWLDLVSQHRTTADDGGALLRAYELVAARRRAFIDAARTYNDQIAAYSELATPDQVHPDRLVAMLIRVSATNAANAPDSSAVQQAGAIDDPAAGGAAGDASSTDGNSAARRNSGSQRFAFRPFAWLRNRERSIVTNRRLLRGAGGDNNQN